MQIALALLAAAALGAGLVLQQRAAEHAPKSHYLRLQLIGDLIRRPWWLAGIGVMVVGQLLSAWTVGHLPLSLAEPLLASSLLFALALAVPLSAQQLRASELAGALLLSGGVAALAVAHSTRAPTEQFGSPAAWPAAAGLALLALGCVHLAQRRRGQRRATLTGVAAGIVLGISDALTRQTLRIASGHPLVALAGDWAPYCVIAASLIAVYLMQSAFNAAPLHASLPGITAAEPLAGLLLGVLVFGDRIAMSPAMIALQLSGLVALVTGVLLVARAPALSQLAATPRWPRPARHGQLTRPALVRLPPLPALPPLPHAAPSGEAEPVVPS